MPDSVLQQQQERTIVLRGYFKELPTGKHLGVCLTLNLVVEADSFERARRKLNDLIAAYLRDAIEHHEVDRFVPRRAPLSFYADYWIHRPATLLLHAYRPRFYDFKERRTLAYA